MSIVIVGAGLAGCECAWTLAETYQQKVYLLDMKPGRMTEAQTEANVLAELVCSNSLKSTSRLNPAGLLKTEMHALGSLLITTAQATAVPAGETLAVDRLRFSQQVSECIRSHPRIKVVEREVDNLSALKTEFAASALVIATGPLTTTALTQTLMEITGGTSGYFYDAIAPIINGESIDYSQVFWQNRETRAQGFARRQGITDPTPVDGGDYLNIPLNKDEYFAFVDLLGKAERVPFHEFEEARFFSGCQPIEALVDSGPKTLSFGPMKPRGLTNPHTGRMPYAAIQLRRETLGDQAFNMVGFQTRLTWPEQRRVFRTLPGLQQVEFFRMGSLHRNTYFVGPAVLQQDFSLRAQPSIFLAGQIVGVEGYIESMATGLWVGHVLGRRATHCTIEPPPHQTALGALLRYALASDPKHFSPMNIHWGLFDALSEEDMEELAPDTPRNRKIDKSLKRHILACRADKRFAHWMVR